MIIAKVHIPGREISKMAFTELPRVGDLLDFSGADVFEVESVWHKQLGGVYVDEDMIPSMREVMIITRDT